MGMRVEYPADKMVSNLPQATRQFLMKILDCKNDRELSIKLSEMMKDVKEFDKFMKSLPVETQNFVKNYMKPNIHTKSELDAAFENIKQSLHLGNISELK